MTIELTKDNFKTEVLESQVPVLVDFFAVWCGPCRMVSPIIDEIASQSQGEYKVGKLNVDEQPEIAKKYGVVSIPTLIAFKNGEVSSKKVGADSKDNILNMLK